MAITDDFRDHNVSWGTSIDKEAPYGTALTTSLVAPNGLSGLFKGPDFAVVTPEIITDEEQVGKGHSFIGDQVVHSWSAELSRNWDATIAWTLWAFAFALGHNEAFAVGPPAVHTMWMMDEETEGKQMPSASIVERVARDVGGTPVPLSQRIFAGMCVNEVTLSAQGKNRLQLSISLLGSGKHADDSTVLTAIVADEYLRGSNVSFLLNATPMRDYIKSWSVKVSNNLMADDGYILGAAADLGLYRERMLYGKRSVELAMTLLAPLPATKNFESLLDGQTEVGPVVITATADAVTEFVKVTIPKWKLTAVPKGVDNNQVIYNLAGNALYNSATQGPIEVVVSSTANVIEHLADGT